MKYDWETLEKSSGLSKERMYADRYDVLMNDEAAAKLNINEGDAIVVYNQNGMFQGRAKFENVKPGNSQVHWSEGNVLIPKGVYVQYVDIRGYNTAVIVEKAETYHALKDTQYLEKRIEELEVNVG
ncbi:molybdopterin dinucleotide binding protein [Effusibacillus lacus]|nr:molybdopterin dinucleotide binding protein [Effusibacillus lacus]